GEAGEKGAAGLQGEAGDKGAAGLQGEAGEKGDKGPPGPPGAPGTTGCPFLSSISMPEAACLGNEYDCNPLPGGSTFNTVTCPDGFLASREQASTEWRSEQVLTATCDSTESTWDLPGYSPTRYYACLSDSNDCGFSVTVCPSNFFCHGSTPIETNRKPKKIECSNTDTFELRSESGVLGQPQTCTKGKWNDNTNWNLIVFCGYACDANCAFKTNAAHTAPNYVDPPTLSAPDAKHTCPFTQCADGAIYAWSGTQYERIPFQKAQCAAGGDATLPWVIGSQRFASIQCYNGPKENCPPVISSALACAPGVTCSVAHILENTIHTQCDEERTLYVSLNEAGPGAAVQDLLTCYDGKWHATSLPGNTPIAAATVYVTCGPIQSTPATPCSIATADNTVCPSSQTCDQTILSASSTGTSCPSGTLYVSATAGVAGSAVTGTLSCSHAGVWTGMAGSTPISLTNVFATCTKTTTTLCAIATADNSVCPSSKTCDPSILSASTSGTSCPSGTLYVSATAGMAGSEVTGALTCSPAGVWTGMAGLTTISYTNIFATCTKIGKGCKMPEYSNSVCKEPPCTENRANRRPDIHFHCEGKDIYISDVATNANPKVAKKQFKCDKNSGLWKTTELVGTGDYETYGNIYFGCKAD
ncbi:hypothetical protein PFISCL1PPCAC_26764, partial [Pristionchus fissidentatus]